MRKIKFRAWNAQKKEMLMGQSVINFTIAHLNLPSFNWMQFTGLTDKKGKEIYEGDILSGKRNNFNSTPVKCTVIWDRYQWGAKQDNELNLLWNKWEIIGNIYENPELIK